MARNYNLMWAVYAIISLQAGSFFTFLETIKGQEVTWTSVSFLIRERENETAKREWKIE